MIDQAQQNAFWGWLFTRGSRKVNKMLFNGTTADSGIGISSDGSQKMTLSTAKSAKGLVILGALGLYLANLATWYLSATAM
ncbi:hypothetical protein GE21DRAFT_1278968 [Neurospora crassa]|nr:hypothetical protein GE21DRAFT_1278968 [Neurospora crassa]